MFYALFFQIAPEEKKDAATISAKPQIKNPIGDVTRFMPTSLKVKRSGRDAKVKKTGIRVTSPYILLL